ncbi:hypothetical protein ACIBI8_35285 [Streptomyces sp. NPDC050529]|uniref:hypothetical protein n=1 Tax=unclassified Streptomyces TaxID=2593676 RepID=UPI002DD99FDB|nr:hypothetical protein [Streptomyces sp. NBC_01022]WRZ81606.1 hypothetical protein OG316_15700 [Streptomyces sp. NBC_01022]
MAYMERRRRLDTVGAPDGLNAMSGGPEPSHATAHGRYLPRSRALRDAMVALDSGIDEAQARHVIDGICREYESVHGGLPLGFLARCHLGPPFVDHQLALDHTIVRHFAPADTLPQPFAAARMLARSGRYAYIEVYSDGLAIPVLTDGTCVRP